MIDRDSPAPAGVALKRLAIVASVVLNVGFLSGVLARSSLPSEAPAAPGSPTSIERAGAAVFGGYADSGRHYAALQSSGLSDEEAQTLLLARLEAYARKQAAEVPPAYWRSEEVYAFDSAQRLAAERDRARAALVEVFGHAAEREPAFATLFRPLDPVFSFLSSAEQVAVQKLKLEQQRDSTSVLAAALPGPLSIGSAGHASASAAEIEDLAALLEPPVLVEYLLRDSALASQLRRSRVEFTETEFRETFKILQRLEESRPDPGIYANARNALRALLGGRRFAALWAGRDPLFGAIERTGAKRALEDETVLSVYELFNDHQDAVLEAARSGDQQRQSEALQEAQARLESRLSGLVGAEVAADIQRSYAQEALSLSRQLTRR